MGGDTNTFYSDEVTKVQRVGESLAVHSHLSKYQSRFMKYFRIFNNVLKRLKCSLYVLYFGTFHNI